MNSFEDRLAGLPVEDLDEIDKAMVAAAESENDESLMSIEAFKESLEEYSGKLVLRIPRSLHKALKDAAAVEGVSLNQYMIYKLAK